MKRMIFRSLIVISITVVVSFLWIYFHNTLEPSAEMKSLKYDDHQAVNPAAISDQSSGKRSSSDARRPAKKDEWFRPWITDMRSKSEGGDAKAASELFEMHTECYVFNGTMQRLNSEASDNVLVQELPKSERELELISARLDLEQDALNRAQKVRELCENLGSVTANEGTYEIALKAAELGDKNASDCYASGAFLIPDDAMPSPSFFDKYKKNAMLLIERQFRRGDWRSISMYEQIYAPETLSFGLFANLRRPDALMAYRYSRLRSLIADDETRQRMMNAFDEETADIPVSQISEANAWAEQMKEKYFSKLGAVDFQNETSFCDY